MLSETGRRIFRSYAHEHPGLSRAYGHGRSRQVLLLRPVAVSSVTLEA